MLVSPTGARAHNARPGRPWLGANQEGDGPSGGLAQSGVACQGVPFAKGQRGHGVAVHTDNLAPATKVAVGLLFGNEVVESLPHGLGVSPGGMSVTGPEVRQQSQAGYRGIGLPVARTLQSRSHRLGSGS